ncbi:MAG: nuclear transport factor 2 family protein [Holophagales bacterium]|nr:nuclear transport factor 2 family protein [Holophagales bacterium]MYH26429.1 nuclear transport factor 2 family protein [Holophagales bacterium]
MKIKAETPFPLDRRALLAAAPLGILAAACAPAEEAGAVEEEAAAAADPTAPAGDDGLTEAETAHRQTARDFVKALETMDWERFSALVADDARFITHAAEGAWARSMTEGGEAILASMQQLMPGLTDPKLMITRERVLGHLVIHEREESFTTDEGPRTSNITAMYLVHDGKVQVWFELVGDLPA